MDLMRLKNELIKEKHALDDQISGLINENSHMTINDATGELSSYDQHPADLASEFTERETDFALKEHKKIRLIEVEGALKRMEDGEYGICARCGVAINTLRLEAEPAAKYCLECEKHVEDETVDLVRPIEEEVISFHDFSYWETEID